MNGAVKQSCSSFALSLLPLRSKREREKKKRVHQTEDKRFSTQSTDERCKGRRKKKWRKRANVVTRQLETARAMEESARRRRIGGGGDGDRASPLRGRVVSLTHTHCSAGGREEGGTQGGKKEEEEEGGGSCPRWHRCQCRLRRHP